MASMWDNVDLNKSGFLPKIDVKDLHVRVVGFVDEIELGKEPQTKVTFVVVSGEHEGCLFHKRVKKSQGYVVRSILISGGGGIQDEAGTWHVAPGVTASDAEGMEMLVDQEEWVEKRNEKGGVFIIKNFRPVPVVSEAPSLPELSTVDEEQLPF